MSERICPRLSHVGRHYWGAASNRAPLSRQRVYPSVAHTRPQRGGMPCLRQSTVARCASNPHARGYKSITRIPTCTLDLLRGCTEGEAPLPVARASFRRYWIPSLYRPRLHLRGCRMLTFGAYCVAVGCQKAAKESDRSVLRGVGRCRLDEVKYNVHCCTAQVSHLRCLFGVPCHWRAALKPSHFVLFGERMRRNLPPLLTSWLF